MNPSIWKYTCKMSDMHSCPIAKFLFELQLSQPPGGIRDAFPSFLRQTWPVKYFNSYVTLRVALYIERLNILWIKTSKYWKLERALSLPLVTNWAAFSPELIMLPHYPFYFFINLIFVNFALKQQLLVHPASSAFCHLHASSPSSLSSQLSLLFSLHRALSFRSTRR